VDVVDLNGEGDKAVVVVDVVDLDGDKAVVVVDTKLL